MVAHEQQQIGYRHHHERHRHAAQQQAITVEAAVAIGDHQHHQHAQQCTDKCRDGQGQQANDLTDMQHHDHRA
ncbi:hypothetical protein D3C76_1627960 [compost metagenome]